MIQLTTLVSKMNVTETLNNSHLKFSLLFKDSTLQPFLYALSKKIAQGNVCLDLNEKQHFFDERELAFFENRSLDIDILEQHPLVGREDEAVKPFILKNNLLYTHRLFTYESRFVKSIKNLLSQQSTIDHKQRLLAAPDLLAFTKSLFPNPTNTAQTNWQFIACLTAFLHPFSIITGGPGTGKTTVVSKLLSLLIKENGNNQPLKIKLAAPTGKARARMEESLKGIRDNYDREGISIDNEILQQIETIKPQTIHRLLGYVHGNIAFKHHENNPLDADVVVIDECSMIDIALFSKLLKAIDPKKTKLILLGDRNQLASVDAGSLFGDLCLSLPQLNEFDTDHIGFFNVVNATITQLSPITNHQSFPLFGHIVELQRSYRFSDDKGIGKFSKAVLNGDWEQVARFQNEEGVIALFENEETKDSDKNAPAWIDHFIKKICKSYESKNDIQDALNSINNYKILSATRKGNQGIGHFNTICKTGILANNKKESPNNKTNEWAAFYHNQLIMVTKNQKDVALDNGDIGIVRYNDQQELTANFSTGDTIKSILAAAIEQHEDAYSITIHKSQGSEFNHVLITIPETENEQFLTRELLYTAVTRAKDSAIILGSSAMIEKMVKNKVARVSGIIQSLKATK